MIYYNSQIYQNRDYYKKLIILDSETKNLYKKRIYNLIYKEQKIYNISRKLPAIFRFLYASKYGINMHSYIRFIVSRLSQTMFQSHLSEQD